MMNCGFLILPFLCSLKASYCLLVIYAKIWACVQSDWSSPSRGSFLGPCQGNQDFWKQPHILPRNLWKPLSRQHGFLFCSSVPGCLQRPLRRSLKALGMLILAEWAQGRVYIVKRDVNKCLGKVASLLPVRSKGWHLLPGSVVSSVALWYFKFIQKLRIPYMWFFWRSELSLIVFKEILLPLCGRNQAGNAIWKLEGGGRRASDLLFLIKVVFKVSLAVPGSSVISLEFFSSIAEPLLCSHTALLFSPLNSAGY